MVGTVGGVSDIDAVVEGVLRVIGDVPRGRGKRLVFWNGFHWVLIVDLGVLIVVAFRHG